MRLGTNESRPPLGPLHVISAVQPDGEPTTTDSRDRLTVLDQELEILGLQTVSVVVSSFDGNHSEDSRAVFGITDDEARALGQRFGQVATFSWYGSRLSVVACVGGRRTDAGWIWTPV